MERKDTLKLDEEFFLIWNFYHFRLRDEDFLDREKFGNGTWDLYWLILVYIYIYRGKFALDGKKRYFEA